MDISNIFREPQVLAGTQISIIMVNFCLSLSMLILFTDLSRKFQFRHFIYVYREVHVYKCVEREEVRYNCVYDSIDIYAYSSFKFTVETDSILVHGLPAQEDQKLQKLKVLLYLLILGNKMSFCLSLPLSSFQLGKYLFFFGKVSLLGSFGCCFFGAAFTYVIFDF